MPYKSESRITSLPVSGDDDLTGRILRARVVKTFKYNCDLALIDEETGREYPKKGRLYQRESLAWKDIGLLGDLPRYQEGRELPGVYVRHLRPVGSEQLWFVHERWGASNPWDSLSLQVGDLVYGTVTFELSSRATGEVAGYLMQLDDGPLRTLDGELDESGIHQPDIEVFIPVEELPWEDGSVGGQAPKAGMSYRRLHKHDRVQAMLLDIRRPPQAPDASVIRLIHHRDAHGNDRQIHWETAARLRFRLLFGKRVDIQDDSMPEQPLLEGKRLLLVDDDERALLAYADLYRQNGAHVETLPVQRDRFTHACGRLTDLLANANFDLVMVDNNLPGQGLGERIIEMVSRRLGDKRPRFLLLTANPLDARTTLARRQTLQTLGVTGFLHRPLSPEQLQSLLAGECLWEESTEATSKGVQVENPVGRDRGASPKELLDELACLPEVRFAMLLRPDPDLAASDVLTAGQAPFEHSDLKTVLNGTELHLLADGRTDRLSLRADESGNVELRAQRAEPALWQAFSVHGERWILGVGHRRGWNPEPHWAWWQHALAARLEQQRWLAWAHEASSFVELGMAHQGLSHEIFNLRNEMDALLQSGESWLKKPGADPKFLPELMVKLRCAHQDTLDLAEHLLEGLSHRQGHVFLPAALATVRSIVSAECESKNLRLDMGQAPPIALAIPSAALVLPVVNLALNAAKHHFRQENRCVSVVVDVAREPGQATLLVDVRDNGPGLSVAARARLWRPGHSFASNREDRHGMGLWLSRRLAEEAGGRLDCVENWRFLGTQFRLAFPIKL